MRFWERKVSLNITDKSGVVRSYSDLDIDFAVVKTTDENANTAKIIIYNMNEDGRKFVSKEGIAINLLAGYEDNVSSIFSGAIIDKGLSHEYNGVDWATVMDCQDGRNGLNNVKVNKSFAGKVGMDKAIGYLIDEMGLGRGVLNIPKKDYNNGIALSGYARDRLQEICDKEKLRFSVQDGNAYILPENSKFVSEVVVLKSDTGLVDSPIMTKDGIKARTMLNARIKIGYEVEIQAKNIDKGRFRVDKLTHSGNNSAGAFYTDIEGVAI